MDGAWILTQLTPHSPGFWLALSWLTLPGVLIAARRMGARGGRWLFAARWVLIPYAGLMAGALSPRLMGLSTINWATTLGLGVVLLFGILLLAIVVRLFMIAGDLSTDDAARTDGDDPPAGWVNVGLSALMTGAEQFHWAFVRGAIWELLLLWPQPVERPAYFALWIATLLTLPEIWLQPIALPQRLVKSVLLVMTAIFFLYTRNFWLAWLAHFIAWFVLTQRAPGNDPDPSAVGEGG